MSCQLLQGTKKVECPHFCPLGIQNIAGEAGNKGMDSCMTKQATSKANAYDSE